MDNVNEDVLYEIFTRSSITSYPSLVRVCRRFRDIIEKRNIKRIKTAKEFTDACIKGDCMSVHYFRINSPKKYQRFTVQEKITMYLNTCFSNKHLSLFLYIYLNAGEEVYYDSTYFMTCIKEFFVRFWVPDFTQTNTVYKYMNEINNVIEKFKKLDFLLPKYSSNYNCYKYSSKQSKFVYCMSILKSNLYDLNISLTKSLIYQLYNILDRRNYNFYAEEMLNNFSLSDNDILFKGIKDIYILPNSVESQEYFIVRTDPEGKTLSVKEFKDIVIEQNASPLINSRKIIINTKI